MATPVNTSPDGNKPKATKSKLVKKKAAADQFPELPKAESLKLPPSPTFPMQIITMNASGPNGREGPTAQSRKKCIAEVLANDPHILLIQEFKWKGIRGKAWKDIPLPDRYTYTGNKEAGVIYDTERFLLKELPQAKLQAPLEELKRKNKVSQDFSPLARSCIRLLETNGPTSSDAFKVFVVSWHGVHRCTKKAKKTQFKHLQEYLKELSLREDAAVLLGGDFNIKISLIKSIVFEDFILYEYTPSKRRKRKVIDYFMTSPKLDLTDVRYIDLAKMKVPIQDPYRMLDHDPVSATVAKRKAMQDKTLPMTSTLKPYTPAYTRGS